MIANMTNSEFYPVSFENFICLLPLFVHMTCKDKLERITLEPLANYVCLLLLFVLFYSHIALLSMQYLARNPERRFWTLT